MKKYTMEEAKQELLSQLDLEGRSIIFHTFEIDGETLVGSGIIGDRMDLEESDRYYDYCDEYSEEPEFQVYDITTYCIGEGESDNADSDECAIIENMLYNPKIRSGLAEYLDEEVECINHINYLMVDNPCWVSEEDDEDGEEEGDE